LKSGSVNAGGAALGWRKGSGAIEARCAIWYYNYEESPGENGRNSGERERK
jgi:hypothetical protein